MARSKRSRVSQYGETKTAEDQLVTFTCAPEDAEQVKKFLGERVYTIRPPVTGQVQVPHGAYGKATRYTVVQHKYAGGAGYIEVLEIQNPPDDRCGIVMHEWEPEWLGVHAFTEWETLDQACAAFERVWGGNRFEETLSGLPGFKRRVPCGALTPWFYAIGEERLVGDYAFPDGLQDDPVFRFGRQCVVCDRDGVPELKTCMGTRLVTRRREGHLHDEEAFRMVYWHDGSVWNERHGGGVPPRPLEDGEAWIAEAVREFYRLLSGQTDAFTIRFLDGSAFLGKRAEPTGRRLSSAPGRYDLVVRLKGEKKSRSGRVDFLPTAEAPDIMQYVTQQFASKGQTVESVKIRGYWNGHGRKTKKWPGVFFAPRR